MTVILPIAVTLVSWFCPTYVQIVLLIASAVIPDSVPVLDEIIQAVGLIKNMRS